MVGSKIKLSKPPLFLLKVMCGGKVNPPRLDEVLTRLIGYLVCKYKMVECNQCGKCCYPSNGRRCRNLVYLKSGKAYCRIYPKRIGHKIAKINGINYVCGYRKLQTYNIPGCPYNIEGREEIDYSKRIGDKNESVRHNGTVKE